MNRNRCCGMILGCLLVVVLGPPLGAQPPELHLVGDHWTAWNPPALVDGNVYIVRRGDSLWKIAAEQLGDPYLWPQIWEQNQYILDSHWIYPGDPISLSGVASAQIYDGSQGVVGPPLDDMAAEGDGVYGDPSETADDGEGIDDLLGLSTDGQTGPVPLGYEADLYCTGYVGDLNEEFAYRVAGSEFDYLTPSLSAKGSVGETEGLFGKAHTEKYGLGPGDIVYLDGGRADGLSAGELLSAVDPVEELRHPRTGESLGRLFAYQGRVRVLSVQEETALAEIVQLCSPRVVGTYLKIFEPEPVPLRRITPMRPVNFPASLEELEGAPSIISALDNLITGAGLITLGAGYMVLIDTGYNQDTAPGDIFTIYRRGREGYPPTIIGELGVLRVFENTSLARIVRSRYAVYLGDPLQLK